MRLLTTVALLVAAVFLGQPTRSEAAPLSPANAGVHAEAKTIAEPVHRRYRRAYRHHRHYSHRPRFYYGLSFGPAFYGGWSPRRHYRHHGYYHRPHYGHRRSLRRW